MINTSSQWLIRVHNDQYEFTMINTSSQWLIRVHND